MWAAKPPSDGSGITWLHTGKAPAGTINPSKYRSTGPRLLLPNHKPEDWCFGSGAEEPHLAEHVTPPFTHILPKFSSQVQPSRMAGFEIISAGRGGQRL